jgi:hypothetical protein
MTTSRVHIPVTYRIQWRFGFQKIELLVEILELRHGVTPEKTEDPILADGLHPGEEIVALGAHLLQDGQHAAAPIISTRLFKDPSIYPW